MDRKPAGSAVQSPAAVALRKESVDRKFALLAGTNIA